MADFRSERMPTPEGEGNAQSAWESAWTTSYRVNKAVNERLYALAPWMKTLNKPQAGRALVDLLGFWLLWHMSGGFEGVQKATGMSRAAVYRRIALFREVFKQHPDVFHMPGVTIDLPAAVREAEAASGDSQQAE